MTDLQVNDVVRVIQADGELGPTRWVIQVISPSGTCIIAPEDQPLAGREFYLAQLKAAEDEPMCQAAE